jgi:hypothetical protein
MLRGPRNEVVAKEHNIARGGLASVRTTSPISIGIDNKISRNRWSQQEAKVESALNITKNPLQGSKMRLTRVVHVKTDLLNSIYNVWASECQVLKSSSKTAKVCSIRHKGPLSCSNLRIGVNWSRARLALRHPGAIQNIQHILSL